MKIKDRFWLWGHPEGRYNTEYGNNKVSRMTPAEGCAYLGVNNVFMVPVGVDVNRRTTISPSPAQSGRLGDRRGRS